MIALANPRPPRRHLVNATATDRVRLALRELRAVLEAMAGHSVASLDELHALAPDYPETVARVWTAFQPLGLPICIERTPEDA